MQTKFICLFDLFLCFWLYASVAQFIVSFQQAHPAENYILMDDDVTSHRARVVTAYKQANNVITEDWPVRFPDLHMI